MIYSVLKERRDNLVVMATGEFFFRLIMIDKNVYDDYRKVPRQGREGKLI